MKNNEGQILYVEDNDTDEMLATHAFKLQWMKQNVHIVRDGTEALEYLFCTGAYADRALINPKVVMLDLKLPLVSGIEVLTQIRSNPRTKYVPVVMFTASSEESDIDKAYSAGVTSYIVKPVVFEEFCEVVQQLQYYWLEFNHQPTIVNNSAIERISQFVRG
jgi:two-component system, response regulator